jgi:hypothetical protein
MRPRLDIKSYIKDGFEHVCDITEYQGNWHYTGQGRYMYDPHTSWVYAITNNDVIEKIGESGNPLGIRGSGNQPRSGSTSRLGRYPNGGGTDKFVRDSLRSAIQAGNQVSIWAKKCDIIETAVTIDGMSRTVNSAIHKELEKEYLDYIKKGNAGNYPNLNKGRA